MPPLDYAPAPRFPSVAQTTQVTRVMDLGPWAREAHERLKNLAAMPDNWDGQGSEPLTAEVKIHSLAIIDLVTKLKMPSPHIVPVSGGGLQLEWFHDKGELEIEILPNGSVIFLAVDSKKNMLSGEISNSTAAIEFVPVTCWFINKKEDFTELATYASKD